MPEGQSWAQGGDFLRVTQLVELGSKEVGRDSQESFARYGDPQGVRRQGVNCSCVFLSPCAFPRQPRGSHPTVFHAKPLPLYRNSLAMVTHPCNPSTQEMEEPKFKTYLGYGMKPYLKNKTKEIGRAHV